MEYESVKTEENLVSEMSYPLYNGKGWLKFYGIITIISGVISALSIVGILYAWLPIWLGVLINGAANKVETAYNTGNKYAFIEAQRKLNTYFVINSVIILVGLVLFVLIVIAFVAGLFTGVNDNLLNRIIY